MKSDLLKEVEKREHFRALIKTVLLVPLLLGCLYTIVRFDSVICNWNFN